MTKEAKPDAWMPLYIGDWDGDTGHLDCEQDGAYGRLVRHYWRTGPLPDDDHLLSRIVRMQTGRWRKLRPSLAAFFVIADGKWRHKRVDAELERWAAKKVKAVERAKQGAAGRWKNDASSNATSTQQALLKRCPSSSSREVDGPTGHSTLSGQNEFSGPKEVREAFLAKMDDHWVRAYVDPCGWQDVPDRGLIPPTPYTAKKIRSEAGAVLLGLGIVVLDRAA